MTPSLTIEFKITTIFLIQAMTDHTKFPIIIAYQEIESANSLLACKTVFPDNHILANENFETAIQK